MLKTITFTSPALSTFTSIPKGLVLGLKKLSSSTRDRLGVGVTVSEPVGVKVAVMVGV